MKKVLITVLLLANICSGTAFAWDKYTTFAATQDSAVSALVTDTIHNHTTDTGVGDHCAHGAAHLVGIFYNAALPIVASIPNHQASALAPLASLYISPLLRPPIV